MPALVRQGREEVLKSAAHGEERMLKGVVMGCLGRSQRLPSEAFWDALIRLTALIDVYAGLDQSRDRKEEECHKKEEEVVEEEEEEEGG